MIILSATASMETPNDNVAWIFGIILLWIIGILIIFLICNLIYYKITGEWLTIGRLLKRKESHSYESLGKPEIHMGGALDTEAGPKIDLDVIKYSSIEREKKAEEQKTERKEHEIKLLFEEIYNADIIGKCTRCDADLVKNQVMCAVCGKKVNSK